MERLLRTAAAVMAIFMVNAVPGTADARHDQHAQVLSHIERQVLEDLLRGRYVNSRGERIILDNDSYQDRLTRSQYDSLPPGIRKRLAQGKPLPPGIAKKMTLLPTSYNRYLGYPVNNHIRVGVLDRDLIIFDAVSRLILDVIRNR